MHTKRNIFYPILALLLMAMTAASLFMGAHLRTSSEVLNDTGLKTGVKNSVLGYDNARGMLLSGTYDNKLIAFREGAEAWSFDTKGSFVRLLVRGKSNTVYAASTDNHVYVLDLDTGALKADYTAQRRIFDIDVNADETLLLVSAGVNAAKHNLMQFNLTSGEQVFNQQYRTQYKGCAFTSNGSAMLLVNNRGELQKMTLEGEELAKATANFEQVMLRPAGPNAHISLGTDGACTVFDDEMNVLRSVQTPIEAGDIPTAVGMDADGAHIFVGTKGRYLYVMNETGDVVYSARLENSPSDFLAVDDDVYVTGLGDFIFRVEVSALSNNTSRQSAAALLKRLTLMFGVLCALFALLSIPDTRRLLERFVRALVKHRVAYLLLIPTFTLLILFNYIPTFMAFTRAFTNWSKTSFQAAQLKLVGFDNFRTMLSENYFLRGVKNLGLIMLFCFAKVLTVPLLLAWMVSMMRSPRKKYAYRFLLVLPIVVPGVVSALLWKQIYDPQIGLLNQLLGKLGLLSWQRVWLGNERTALGSIIFMGFPFINAMAFLVYYGGFSNIDQSIFESARVDGANRGRIFWSIQLPMIGAQIKLMLILTFIGSVQEFYPIYLLTGGGPGTSTYVPGLELYLNATTFGRYGYACALGIVMFLFIMMGTILNMRLQARNAGKGVR